MAIIILGGVPVHPRGVNHTNIILLCVITIEDDILNTW